MKNLLITALVVAASSAHAFAGEEAFTALDSDKDGMISLEEAKLDTSLSEAFASLDLDNDGFLSLVEFASKAE